MFQIFLISLRKGVSFCKLGIVFGFQGEQVLVNYIVLYSHTHTITHTRTITHTHTYVHTLLVFMVSIDLY